ncbi:hypothetical protein AAZX31_11G019000 [Glycine max]
MLCFNCNFAFLFQLSIATEDPLNKLLQDLQFPSSLDSFQFIDWKGVKCDGYQVLTANRVIIVAFHRTSHGRLIRVCVCVNWGSAVSQCPIISVRINNHSLNYMCC